MLPCPYCQDEGKCWESGCKICCNCKQVLIPDEPRRIVQDPEVLGGKPHLEGTQISVREVLGLIRDTLQDQDLTLLRRELEGVTKADTLAVLDFVANHKVDNGK